ncbi:ATP-binding cassette domain-containing protein, partial [Arthrobacter sp. LS16]|uniref:ATP-binding cassette domain-containing protein n=1 Tax=Arthrobacter sp. 'calajunan' TaxID=1690248 RepID=UPI003C709726
ALVARIGSVFQEPEHQFVTQSVREELAFAPLRARHGAAEEQKYDPRQVEARVQELLERLGLQDLAEANPVTLSGGEKRRLSVATVLAASPDVVILD